MPPTDNLLRLLNSGSRPRPQRDYTAPSDNTNIENNMCYIGQSVNVADRFKQHIKRGLGAETPTRNKLYPAMLSIGVENFTFEIIEECDRSLLDSREDYWQDFYHAKDYGYSIM